jgi:hypothetical protein
MVNFIGPANNEIENLYKTYPYESVCLHGRPISIIYQNRQDDLYKEGQILNTTTVNVRGLVDDNPNQTILKKLGWFKENEDTIPYIVNIPVFYNSSTATNMYKGCVLDLNLGTKLYVTNVKKYFEYGYWYALKCVYYEENRVNQDTHPTEVLRHHYINEEE